MHVNTHIGQMRHTKLLVRDNSENYSQTTVSILAAWGYSPGIVIGASLDCQILGAHHSDHEF